MPLSRLSLTLLATATLVACQREPTAPARRANLAADASGFQRRIAVSPDHLELRPGTSAQLSTQVFTNEGELLSNATISFTSADPQIATVSATGLVTAGTIGSTTVTVSSKGAADVPAPVSVSAVGHPAGTIAATLRTSSRLFGTAVSGASIVYLTQPDPQLLQRIDLPTAAFSGTVSVGQQPTDVAFDVAGAFAYVTNQFDADVGVVATSTNSVTGTIHVPLNPFRVIAGVDDHSAFVSGNQPLVAIVDRQTLTTTATIPLPGLSNGLSLNSTRSKLYASLLFNAAVVEFDAVTHTALRTFTIPGAGTLQAVAISRNDGELYVADEGAGQLWIIDLATGTVSGSVALGGGGFEVKVSPDNVQLYVALSGSGLIRVIDRATRTVIATISTGGAPRRLAFTNDGATAVIANEAGWVDIIH